MLITAEENLGLVHMCAGKLRGKGIEYEELYSAGCIGLVKAVKAFDPSRGVQFSTYAVPVIFGEMKRLFRDGGTVKVSRSLKELSLRISRERDIFIRKNGREPKLSELASALDTDITVISEAIASSAPVLSLTVSTDEGEEQTDISVESPENEISDMLALRQSLDQLSADDRELITFRYFRNMTQSETALSMNTTQVQVSRREKKILRFLREKMLE